MFTVLLAAFETARGTAFERFLVEDLIMNPTTALINLVTPGDHVHLKDRTIVSPGANLHVTRGCEGIEMFLLLIAGIAAFPAGNKRRVAGLLTGAALAYVLSV